MNSQTSPELFKFRFAIIKERNLLQKNKLFDTKIIRFGFSMANYMPVKKAEMLKRLILRFPIFPNWNKNILQ